MHEENCPHCDKPDFVPDADIDTTLNYGTTNTSVVCRYCNGRVRLTLSRKVTVVLSHITKE